jgi:hypothetical protein
MFIPTFCGMFTKITLIPTFCHHKCPPIAFSCAQHSDLELATSKARMKRANMRANQDLKNTRDFGEHAAEGGNICGIDEYTKEGGNKRDFGEHATEGGNKRNFGEHATISGNKRDLYPPLWEYGTRLFVYATKRQRKGWQLVRAALTGNATLMEHSLVDQTALTNGLHQRP